MNHSFASRLLAAVASLAAAALVQSCGSGAVSGPPTVNTGAVTVTPATATLFAGLPSTFVITGGNGRYNVISNNQAIVPSIANLQANSFTVLPQEVPADTDLALTIQDVVTTNSTIANLTVKPRTISNTVTVTPSPSQSTACGSSVCAGGDAEVKIVLAQAGVPITARSVRIDVLSGDARLILSDTGGAEVLGTSITTVTDGTGTARVRVRVLASAQSQTALLQATDLASGFVQTLPIPIAPSSNAPLSAQPNTIAFRSQTNAQCPNGLMADVIVFGGRPPYLISQPGTVLVSPLVVEQSGGRFTVTARGQCTDGSAIAVVDSNGASVTVNVTATSPPLVSGPALAAAPAAVTLDSCDAISTITVAGGIGPPYFASSGHSSVRVVGSGDQNRFFISRARPSPAAPTSVTVSFSDGATVKDVTVSLTGLGAGGC